MVSKAIKPRDGLCARCGAHVAGQGLNFCPKCGQRLERREASALPSELGNSDQTVAALAIVMLTMIAGLASSYFLRDAGDVLRLLAMEAATAVGAWWALRVSAHGVREALPYRLAAKDLIGVPLAAAFSLAAALGYVWLLTSAIPIPPEAYEREALRVVDWVAILVLAPLVEEAMFRGIVFSLLQRFMGPIAVVALSAALFAFMHGLNGAYILEYPHRFVGGLAFGYLRLRTKSLAAPTLAHALHNLVASLL